MCIYKGGFEGSAFHQLYFHFIWGTYERLELIDSPIEKRLKKLIDEKIQEHRSELISFGCTRDHVHLLVRLHPGVSVADLVGEVKGYSSFVIANQINCNSSFRWQRGYGALSLSVKDVLRIMRYIENQKEQHAMGNLNNDYEITS